MGAEQLQTVADAFERWSAGDFDGAAALCTEDVEWYPRIDLDQRVARGREQVAAMFRDRAEHVDLRMDFSRMEPVGDEVVVHVLAEATGGESGAKVAEDWFQLHRLQDGLICKIENFDTREQAVAAAEAG